MIFGFGRKKPDFLSISNDLENHYEMLSRDEKNRFEQFADSIHFTVQKYASIHGVLKLLEAIVVVKNGDSIHQFEMIEPRYKQKDSKKYKTLLVGFNYSVCFQINTLKTVAWLKDNVNSIRLSAPTAAVELNPALSRISEEIALWVLKRRQDLVMDEDDGFFLFSIE